MLEVEIQASIKGHQKRNTELMKRLRAKGAILGEPRSIDLHFWAPSQKHAALLSRALYERGFLVLVLAPANSKEDPKRWNIEAGVRQSINITIRKEFVEGMVRMASDFSSEFDGWGTSLDLQ